MPNGCAVFDVHSTDLELYETIGHGPYSFSAGSSDHVCAVSAFSDAVSAEGIAVQDELVRKVTFTTWELVRGSNVVRNLRLEAPLSAALANGDDTLSITADCYSIAAADCWPTTPPHKWTRCWSTTERALRSTRRRPAPSRLRCWPTTPRRKGRAVGRLPHGKRAGHADAGRPSQARCWPTGRARTRTFSQTIK